MPKKISENTVFADRLRSLRTAQKWTQQDVADRLGIKRSTYAYYETCTSEPDLETLTKLASLFHTTVDFLVGHPSSENPRLFFYNRTTEDKNIVLTKREESMLQMFRAIDNDRQEIVLRQMYEFLRNEYDHFPSEETMHT